MSEKASITITSLHDLFMLSEWYRKGEITLNLSKIARELNCDRKTIKRRLEGVTPKTTRNRRKYLDDFKPLLLSYLQESHRHFSYIDLLFYFMRREHQITCSRSTFYRYIVNDIELCQSFKQNNETTFTQRFETKPGQQAQFDLKEKVKLVTKGGEKITAYILTLILSWSRYNVRRLILNPTTDNLISFLAEAFEEIEGVPNELVIDNLKAFVEKPRSSSEDNAVLTSRFSEFCKDYDIDVFACMPYRPQTKGKTETQNKWVEQLYNYNGTFGGLWEMHHRLKQLNDEDNMAASQATQLPRQFLLEKEKGDLAPLPSPAVRHPYHLHLKKVHVTNDALFQYRYNKYSLAKEFIGKPVEIVVQNNKLHIYYNGNIIDVHPITDNHFNIKPEHQLYYAKTKDDKVEKNAIEAPPAPNIISTELGDIRYDSLSKIQEQLTYLKFKSAQHYLEQLFHDCQLTEAELSGLYKVLAKEVEAKEENKSLYNVKVAAFPYLKTIDDYDFSFQPSIDEDQIRAIIDSSFYEEAKNVVLVGNPGTGKTHLAISIAYSVAIKRNSVYFIKFNKLIHSLRTAYQEGALERKIKVLFKYKLLVIDEVGFNEISSLEAKLFFQLIDWSYTKRFTVFASNLTFDKWHTIMGQDEMLTKAIVDRILHHAYLFNITGPSYRIKDKISPPKSGES